MLCIYQVALDREYDDIAGVEVYTLTASSWSSLYSSALSIFLSPTQSYLCPACGVACVTGWGATLNAPLANLATCASTLNNTRFVTVHKPLGSVAGADRLYIAELRVMRALPQSACATCAAFGGKAVPVAMSSSVSVAPGRVSSTYRGIDVIQDGYLFPLYGNGGVQATAATSSWVQVQVGPPPCTHARTHVGMGTPLA